jgi:hypothetical protein
VYDSYESDSDVNMKDFQDHTIDPFSLFIKEKHWVEINHPRPSEDTEQHVKEKHPFIDIHEEIYFPQLADVIRADKEEVDKQPASTFHSPVLSIDIQPDVSSCKIEHVLCYQPSKFRPLFYDPVGEDSITQQAKALELLVLGSSQGACHPLWSQMLSHELVRVLWVCGFYLSL